MLIKQETGKGVRKKSMAKRPISLFRRPDKKDLLGQSLVGLNHLLRGYRENHSYMIYKKLSYKGNF